MDIKKTFQNNDLTSNFDFNSIIENLNALSKESIKPKISAKWFVIRITPDLATGELLNIGVGIYYRKKLFTKLIPNTMPLETLYGKSSRENFSFLLHLLNRSSDNLSALKSISPHFSFSSLKFVSGNSIEDILERLFRNIVTLNLIESPEKQINRNNLNTEKVRKKIFNALKSKDKNLTERIWHNEDNPIIIPPNLGEEIMLNHLQIWSTPNITQKYTKFGSIVSTDYMQKSYSELHFLQATQDIQRASVSLNHDSNKKAGLFIYRPDTLSECIKNDVDDMIDRTHWLINKNKDLDFTMEVESDLNKLIDQTQDFAA